MAKRSRKTDECTIARRQQEGRGQGHGATYKPWLTVQDVPSQGLTHRIQGWTTRRVHHLFSNLERDALYLLDWAEEVIDIREQYPLLPLEETQAIAEQIGVRHPTDPRTQHAVVMTTDFLLDVQTGESIFQQARTAKPIDQLENRRVLEKLEIERRFWQARNVDWGIVTEHEIPPVQSANIRLLHGYQQVNERLPEPGRLTEVMNFLLDASRSRELGDIAVRCDQALRLVPGTALTVLYHLLATRQLMFNLAEPLTSQTVLDANQEAVQS
jgi:hypothetical protein